MKVSAAEWEAGALSDDKVADLVASFDERGLFVLEDVVPEAVLDQLAVKMLADAAAIVAHGGFSARGEFGHGHLQLGPPRMAPHVHAEIVANPIIEQVVVAILRRDARLGFFNGNCAMPSSGIQRLHMDDQWDWHNAADAAAAGEPWPHRTTSVHVNVCPTANVTEYNGGTEVWPASHRVPTFRLAGRQQGCSVCDPLADPAFVRTQQRVSPPTRNCFPRGAAVFRDARIWHRGVPNHSMLPRPNIVIVYHRQDREKAQTNTPGLLFAESARPAFARPNPRVDRNVQFVEDAVNHFAKSHGPGGALVGWPDPAFLGIKVALDESARL